MKRPHKTKSLDRLQKETAYLFVAPFVVGFLLLFLPMVVKTVFFALNTIKVTGDGYTTTFVGMDNFYNATMVNPYFKEQLLFALRSLVTEMPVVLVLSLFVSIILNMRFKGVTFVKAIFFVPVLLATGIVLKVETNSGILTQLQDITSVTTGTEIDAAQFSAITNVLERINLSPQIMDIIVSGANGIYSVLNSCGVQIFIFLAGLQTVPPALHEAASVEGCTAWEFFWKVTLPMLSPIILVNAFYTVVDVFTKPTNSFFGFTDRVAFYDNNFGMATAMNLIYLVLVAVILFLIWFVFRKKIYYENL